eukprot:Plantae.Rhodophyta-Rhodochaete_pulchella.ctg1059.p1 GENE.Plantae.Rhodophyta-Rhodochaete_pulchella.ctg1059~~Plantae.Rhodophyta-Rhodochaete_pulchella.ctg1059.p1  ORF type:complete len:605 (+),score=82.86 Plantae.Rhodophyta-Rhodochaete_pulchella.ctg1059:424-2238(+)
MAIPTRWRISKLDIPWKVMEGTAETKQLYTVFIDQLSKTLCLKGAEVEKLLEVSDNAGREAVEQRIREGLPQISPAVTLVRRSFDCRQKAGMFKLVVDVSIQRSLGRRLVGRHRKGALEPVDKETSRPDQTRGPLPKPGKKVVVVGAGPAGLFAAMSLAESGFEVVLLERGRPVERRGADIGALTHRRSLDPNSNYCFGEGGAGTWSDGKLTTRIGKNSSQVRSILERLVVLGAPQQILTAGKPHLGTDRLVRIIRALREHLRELGVQIHFDTRLESIQLDNDHAVTGVTTAGPDGNRTIQTDAVLLAIGHSACDVYRMLSDLGVSMETKPFAMGMRIEHPQSMINESQYGTEVATQLAVGRRARDSAIPVADYKLASSGLVVPVGDSRTVSKAIWSFCMCPGGQIVPTSISKSHLSVNGMSFSKRASKWANSGIVVDVGQEEFDAHCSSGGPLAGMEFQLEIEARAAALGGGNLVAPVQCASDFLSHRVTPDEKIPSSSYRLGVRSAPLHDLFPVHMALAFQRALEQFEESMPGFASGRALLHAVESRTSAPVRLPRDVNCQSANTPGLFVAGEGAGHAGGIVSAAVDGVRVAGGVLQVLTAS